MCKFFHIIKQLARKYIGFVHKCLCVRLRLVCTSVTLVVKQLFQIIIHQGCYTTEFDAVVVLYWNTNHMCACMCMRNA